MTDKINEMQEYHGNCIDALLQQHITLAEFNLHEQVFDKFFDALYSQTDKTKWQNLNNDLHTDITSHFSTLGGLLKELRELLVAYFGDELGHNSQPKSASDDIAKEILAKAEPIIRQQVYKEFLADLEENTMGVSLTMSKDGKTYGAVDGEITHRLMTQEYFNKLSGKSPEAE